MNYFIIIIISLLFSAFFSGMEIAFVSSNKLRIELDKKQGFIGSRILSVFTTNPGQYIATMLVGNNIALVIYGIVMAIIMEPLIRPYVPSDFAILIIQTIISTLIILITAEFLPKTLFIIKPNVALKVFAIPVFIFYVLLYPIAIITIAISNFILRKILGIQVHKLSDVNAFGKLDLSHLVSQVQSESPEPFESEHDIKIFQNALDFSNVKLRDCMIPRTEIVCVEHNSEIEEVKQKFTETGLSKILVFKDSIDNIIGYVNSKDLFKNPSDIQSMVLTLPIVPETMPANKLLRSFIREHKSIAVVVDEFGGTSGIVTIEDIIEEIFGEIEDEHDTSELTEKRLSDNEFIFSGRQEIDHLNEIYHLVIPKMDDYETLAGFILYHYENIPKVNERIIIEPFTFKILDVSETRIELIHLIKKPVTIP